MEERDFVAIRKDDLTSVFEGQILLTITDILNGSLRSPFQHRSRVIVREQSDGVPQRFLLLPLTPSIVLVYVERERTHVVHSCNGECEDRYRAMQMKRVLSLFSGNFVSYVPVPVPIPSRPNSFFSCGPVAMMKSFSFIALCCSFVSIPLRSLNVLVIN